MSLASDPLQPLHRGPGNGLVAGNLLCVASMLFWAAGFPAAELLLDRWETLTLITARFLMAVAMLIPLWALVDGPVAVLRAGWRQGAVIGGVGFGLGAWLLLLAQSLTDPVTVAIIASATPIAATVLEILLDGRRLTRAFAMGLGASVIGGVVAVSGPLGGGDVAFGSACAVLACFLFVWGSRAAVKDLPELTDLGRTTITLAGGLIATGLIFLGSYAMGLVALPRGGWQGGDLGLLAIYALASMALSQLLWIVSVGRLGVAVASFHINVAPFYVMIILLALGGDWNWRQAAAAALVALGVVLAQWRPRRRNARY